MGEVKITIGYERGKCSICKKMTQVRLIMDKNKICKVCKNCAEKNADKEISFILKKYGKKRD